MLYASPGFFLDGFARCDYSKLRWKKLFSGRVEHETDMNNQMPNPVDLEQALAHWRSEAAREVRDALLADYADRYREIQARIARLREYPPSFDAEDLDAVLARLESAKRIRRQIVEGNDLDLLVATLRTFLFGDAPLAERFALTVPRVRYAGPLILGELFGWVHAEEWPIPTRGARLYTAACNRSSTLSDLMEVARCVAPVREAYSRQGRLLADVPLHVELAAFLDWLAETSALTPPAEPARAVREIGPPYRTGEPTVTFPDRPLTRPSAAELQRAEATIRQVLTLPPDAVRRAVAHLLAGRHLILTGAPGTGKSHLATLLAAEVFGYYPMPVTATAEWSTFDVVGGLVPTTDREGHLRYEVRPGCVYEAIAQNWVFVEGRVHLDAEGRPLRRTVEAEGRCWNGVWLVVDELNRADVDKAFGPLFTALETGVLRVPDLEGGSRLLPIPRDFRIIATFNTRDRHFLFTLSDALKRRFAFLELTPPTDDQAEEEQATLVRRALAALAEQGLPTREAVVQAALEELYPVVSFVRALVPLGTAPVLAALRYVGAAHTLAPQADIKELVGEAFHADILPLLESADPWALTFISDVLSGRPDRLFDRLRAPGPGYATDEELWAGVARLARWLEAVAQQRGNKTARETARAWRAWVERWETSPSTPDAGELVEFDRLLEAARRDLAPLLPARNWLK